MSARKHTRRAGYHSHAALIILLFCVCTVGVLAAYMLIEAGRKSITDQTTTALLQQAQARSSAVASWFESTESPLTALSRQEALTLFAEEVNNLPAGEAARLAGAAQPHAGQEEGEDEVSRLRLQIPAMRSLLAGQISSFVSELDLLTPDKTLLVHVGESRRAGVGRHRACRHGRGIEGQRRAYFFRPGFPSGERRADARPACTGLPEPGTEPAPGAAGRHPAPQPGCSSGRHAP